MTFNEALHYNAVYGLLPYAVTIFLTLALLGAAALLYLWRKGGL